MCGLFAVIPGKKKGFVKQLHQLYRYLAVSNDSRGGHAFGMWGQNQGIVKGLGSIQTQGAFQLGQVIKVWSARPGDWLAGHTRFATHGAKGSLEHAHPFTMPSTTLGDTLTLAHNGIAYVEGFEDAHEVDSCQIAMAVAAHGFLGLEKVDGSCGLLMSIGKKLHMYRSHQELSFASGEYGWAVSSDVEHLEAALHVSGLLDSTDTIRNVPQNVVIDPWGEDGGACFAVEPQELTGMERIHDGIEMLNCCGVCGEYEWCETVYSDDGRHAAICDSCWSRMSTY